MFRLRSVLALALALVATVLVSCGTPSDTQPSTYTTAQIEQIQAYVADLNKLRDRMSEIPSLIDTRRWVDIGSIIHGPLGELRRDMRTVARTLLPRDAQAANAAADDLFDRLVDLDRAATELDVESATQSYRAALKDFDTFLQLVPQLQAG